MDYTYATLLVVLATVITTTHANKVLLVSMDGFRWDYIEKVHTPTFDEMAKRGARAPYINNTFITKTFPCHYTIATGLFEESHGIIANAMYDPVTKQHFNMGTTSTFWWDGGEPLWVTARKEGLKSAVFFWPGSESKIRGFYANIYKPYNESVPFSTRIDTVVDWFKHQNVDLAMLYLHEPDHTGHLYGPNSPEVLQKVVEMDTTLAYLVQKFEENDLWNEVNVLVTSDHGMAEIDYRTRVVDLSLYLDMAAIEEMPDEGPICHILPVDGKEDEIIANLTGVDHLSVYRREEIPDHWHYRNNRRILPILVVADEGWLALKSAEHPANSKGTHGYDNRLSSMKPIFYARGPNIRNNITVNQLNSVDIYPLVCELLGIQPAPNNGSLSNTNSFLSRNTYSSGSGRVVASVLFTLLCICVLR